ncbi:hypothetical protein L6452_32925 [Arctium lappa]|uniref:Uncharacterized protein n=1 Tax=Arctium lappa TaxID=4217 RepID=A0ACB8Z5V8_ARCLA|nr:hypothetical protein L6452_32925 [Arctium lappa]
MSRGSMPPGLQWESGLSPPGLQPKSGVCCYVGVPQPEVDSHAGDQDLGAMDNLVSSSVICVASLSQSDCYVNESVRAAFEKTPKSPHSGRITSRGSMPPGLQWESGLSPPGLQPVLGVCYHVGVPQPDVDSHTGDQDPGSKVRIHMGVLEQGPPSPIGCGLRAE